MAVNILLDIYEEIEQKKVDAAAPPSHMNELEEGLEQDEGFELDEEIVQEIVSNLAAHYTMIDQDEIQNVVRLNIGDFDSIKVALNALSQQSSETNCQMQDQDFLSLLESALMPAPELHYQDEEEEETEP